MQDNPWSTKGRIGRGKFWLRCVVAMLVLIISAVVCKENVQNNGQFLTILASFLCQVASISFVIIQGAKRMHDVDRSAWFFFIPIYGLVAALTRGTASANLFGDKSK